jgi:AcrR family transcriptional regulator
MAVVEHPGGPVEPGSARWWAERDARLGRRRPRADGLRIEQIVEAALALVDDEGLDALTVRRLAARLETGSATLYRHFASRDELLVLLVDRVIGEVRFAQADAPGRTKVEHLSTELRRVLMDHPDLVPALRAAPLLGPNARHGSEQAVIAFLDAGYPAEVAVPAYLALVDYVLGTVFFDTGRLAEWQADAAEAHLAGPLRPSSDARVRALQEQGLAVPSLDDVFSFGLATFLDGLEVRWLGPADASTDR